MVKISVIGAGNVGSTTVQRLAELEPGEIVMTDIVNSDLVLLRQESPESPE